jgi:hypothetical protein
MAIERLLSYITVPAVVLMVFLPTRVMGGTIFDVTGTVVEAEASSLLSVGDSIQGWVELEDSAAQPNAHFNVLEGTVLDLYVRIGSFVWDSDDPSILWAQFEGFMSTDGTTFGNMTWKLLQNFVGVLSPQCPVSMVCALQGGPTFGQQSDSGTAGLSYSFVRRSIPEPTTLVLFGLGLAGLASATRRRGL